MTPDRALDVLTMLSAALHGRGEEKDRNIRRAMEVMRAHCSVGEKVVTSPVPQIGEQDAIAGHVCHACDGTGFHP